MFQQLKTPHFPHRMYVCALYEPSHKLIIYLHDIYWMVSVMEVDSAVRNGSMCIIWTTEVFKDVAVNRKNASCTSQAMFEPAVCGITFHFLTLYVFRTVHCEIPMQQEPTKSTLLTLVF